MTTDEDEYEFEFTKKLIGWTGTYTYKSEQGGWGVGPRYDTWRLTRSGCERATRRKARR